MQAHLLYLKYVFAITNVKDGVKQGPEFDAPPSDYSADPLSSDRLGQPSSEAGPYQSSSSDDGLGGSKLVSKKTVIGKKGAYTTDYEEIDSAGLRQNWDLAALKYMDLICLHPKAVTSLCKTSDHTNNFRIRDFLKAARFECVRCFQEQADSNMMSMRKVMETLKFPSGNETEPDNVAKIKAFIQKHEQTKEEKPVISDATWEDEKNFDGNFHCETLILSLQLLHKKQAVRDAVSSDKNSDNSYLQLPPKHIVDRFANPAKVLPVSKRCCPVCHALLKYVSRKANEQILYPEHHENWFTAALPPWIPRKTGMAAIKAAKEKLVERVKKYLRSDTPQSGSSTGIPPMTSYCSDDLEDLSPGKLRDHMEWMKDQGEKRKRRKSEEVFDAGRSPSLSKRR